MSSPYLGVFSVYKEDDTMSKELTGFGPADFFSLSYRLKEGFCKGLDLIVVVKSLGWLLVLCVSSEKSLTVSFSSEDS